jgi:hypothetical protein
MISRVKKNKPSFNGRFMALPPISKTDRENKQSKDDLAEVKMMKEIESTEVAVEAG